MDSFFDNQVGVEPKGLDTIPCLFLFRLLESIHAGVRPANMKMNKETELIQVY